MEELLQWGKENGIVFPEGIRFEFDENKGYRAICTDPVLLKNPQITVPNDCIIDGNMALKVFGKKDNGLLKFLLAKLMFDKEENTIIKNSENESIDLTIKFKPYLKALPNVVDSPLVWNPDELALLENTNLGNSIRDKLKSIYQQYIELIDENEFLQNYRGHSQKDIELFENFDSLAYTDIYENIIKVSNKNIAKAWYSFPAFLWSHLIFTSRAFPEYIINKDCDVFSIILLPILDLLNHDYNSKVEWSTNKDQSFILTVLDENNFKQGEEIYNNYGGKGNEELLVGYGFVLEENPFDSVLLKVKLPPDVISKILEDEPSIKLPTIDDYTTFAFDNRVTQEQAEVEKDKKDISRYKDGITFLLNKSNNECITILLRLFAYLSKNTDETIDGSIRARFEGLQMLRNAIQHKLTMTNINGEKTTTESSKYTINPYRHYCADTYRQTQRDILKSTLSKLKTLEKEWLTTHKSELLTMAKILKHDNLFTEEELGRCFAYTDEEVAFDSTFDLFVIWLIVKIQNGSFIKKYKWVKDQYDTFVSTHQEELAAVSEDARAFHDAYFDTSSSVTVDDTNKAFHFITERTFTRVSGSNETILVLHS